MFGNLLNKRTGALLFLIIVVFVLANLYYNDIYAKYFTKADILSWNGVQTHKNTLVDWKQVNKMRKVSKFVDWSKVKRRKRPRKKDMHDKWIVVTSIAAPTSDVKLLSEIPGWKLLVVGDKKTPTSWSLPNAVYLSVERQLELGYRTAEVMPYSNYARKTIGHLYAIQHGAKMIYETDDDTHPYNNTIKFFQKQTGDFYVYSTNRITVNPYAHFGQASIWPRGYPLENVANPPVHTYVKCQNARALIQQGVVDGDPDVDAVFRLTRKDDGVQLDLRFDPKAPPVLIPPGAYTPYNCQNTLHFYDAFWGLVLPPSGTLRVTDIWRSFYVQRLLQEINGYLAYFGPTAYQVRNAHNYLRDFIDEEELYYKSGRYLAYLEKWDGKDLDFFNRMLKLAIDLVVEDIWKPIDAVVVEAWIEDLVSFGYKPPRMSKTPKPCENVVEKEKEMIFQQQPSSYLRIGKKMKEIIQT